jgi:hypothetical protein
MVDFNLLWCYTNNTKKLKKGSKMQVHRVYVEVGSYMGEGTSGAFITESLSQFETTITANSSGDAVRIAMAQYGGQERCRVTYRGLA